MNLTRIAFFTLFILIASVVACKAQAPDSLKKAFVYLPGNTVSCEATSRSILLNSAEEKDDWQIVSGPEVKGLQYPVQACYSKPFPSWEMDRYTADSSYFKNSDWMVLPDKKKVVNTVSRIPIVFIKRFKTLAPSRLKLMVKILYDNMAYLYIDSTWIKLGHRNPDINNFIQKLQPELSGFVSIPATFNFSYNASFYAGNFYNMVLPAGDHAIKIELFNNAYETGCIVKGILMSEDDKKIFCGPAIKDENAALESILVFPDKKAFPGNGTADTLYAALMQTVKTAYWINNRVNDSVDLISNDTLFLKKGEKINLTPAYVTQLRNGKTDTLYASGSVKKITTAKAGVKQWKKTVAFDALVHGNYLLEINCESPGDAKHSAPDVLNKYVRVIKVK